MFDMHTYFEGELVRSVIWRCGRISHIEGGLYVEKLMLVLEHSLPKGQQLGISVFGNNLIYPNGTNVAIMGPCSAALYNSIFSFTL